MLDERPAACPCVGHGGLCWRHEMANHTAAKPTASMAVIAATATAFFIGRLYATQAASGTAGGRAQASATVLRRDGRPSSHHAPPAHRPQRHGRALEARHDPARCGHLAAGDHLREPLEDLRRLPLLTLRHAFKGSGSPRCAATWPAWLDSRRFSYASDRV